MIAVLSQVLGPLPEEWVSGESLSVAPSEVDWLVILSVDAAWAEDAIERCLSSGFSAFQLALGGPGEAPWLESLREHTGCHAFAWKSSDDTEKLSRALRRVERDATAELLDREVRTAMETGALALLGDPARAVELAHFSYAIAAETGLGLRATERVVRLALYFELAGHPELERVILCSRNLWPIRNLLQAEAASTSAAAVPLELELVRRARVERKSEERKIA